MSGYKKGRKRTSIIWNYFYEQGTMSARCNLCLKTVISNGEVRRLRYHLRTQHKDLDLGQIIANARKEQSVKVEVTEEEQEMKSAPMEDIEEQEIKIAPMEDIDEVTGEAEMMESAPMINHD